MMVTTAGPARRATSAHDMGALAGRLVVDTECVSLPEATICCTTLPGEEVSWATTAPPAAPKAAAMIATAATNTVLEVLIIEAKSPSRLIQDEYGKPTLESD